MILLYLLSLFVFVKADWDPVTFFSQEQTYDNPVSNGYAPETLQGSNDQCGLFKVSFTQDYYEQYIEYKADIPNLKEFTLCYWVKFYNHSNDHPIFSYGDEKHPREIFAWVSNTDESSFFSMSVKGQTFFRLNYPLKVRRWYHVCQSWNGKTGEWQIWVNAERVGRGFHNRLVGYTIPRGGTAVSGQEIVKNENKDSVGLQGELTMLQLYSVALTAGKAHKDHKHHHAHKFDHNGVPITTPPPTTPNPRPTLPTHPLLTSGQLNPSIRLNIAGPQQQAQPQIVPGQNFNAQYLNGQFVGNLVSRQFLAAQQQQQQQVIQQQQQQQQQGLFQTLPEQSYVDANLPNTGSFSKQTLTIGNTQLLSSGVEHPAGQVQFIQEPQRLFKRSNTESKTKSKRELYLTGASLIGEDANFGGLATIGENQPVLNLQQQNDEREPAEAESKAVMNVCTGCDEEPFEKALVFGWRTVTKKLYGATYAPAISQCKVF